MNPTTRSTRSTGSVLVIATLLGAAALTGCNQPGAQNATTAATDTSTPPALPLTTNTAPVSAAAPVATALPAASPVRVVHLADPSQGYAYADRAYRYARVLADAPPDYTFDYDGVRPYVWTSNGAYEFAEPTAYGERYYYFDPGADYPYLIRDNDYSYGYDNTGALVVVYDRNGRIMDPRFIDQRADFAGRYLARARALREAALSRQRQAVAVANWAARRSQIQADRTAWQQQQAQYPDWRAYDQTHAAEEDSYWANVQQRRAAESQAYDQALGNAYGQGRADQRSRDQTGLEVAGGVAALAAAAAIYNAGHHNHGAPPPPPMAAAPGPAPAQAPVAGPAPQARPGMAPAAPQPMAGAPQNGRMGAGRVEPGPAARAPVAQGPAAGAAAQQAAETQRATQAEHAAEAERAQQAVAAQQAAEAQRTAQMHGQQAVAAQQAAAAQHAQQAAAAKQAAQAQQAAQIHAQQAAAAEHAAAVHTQLAAKPAAPAVAPPGKAPTPPGNPAAPPAGHPAPTAGAHPKGGPNDRDGARTQPQ